MPSISSQPSSQPTISAMPSISAVPSGEPSISAMPSISSLPTYQPAKFCGRYDEDGKAGCNATPDFGEKGYLFVREKPENGPLPPFTPNTGVSGLCTPEAPSCGDGSGNGSCENLCLELCANCALKKKTNGDIDCKNNWCNAGGGGCQNAACFDAYGTGAKCAGFDPSVPDPSPDPGPGPSPDDSEKPSSMPSSSPSSPPSDPSDEPSFVPSSMPSSSPSTIPSSTPSDPSDEPSLVPSSTPSTTPVASPTCTPTTLGNNGSNSCSPTFGGNYCCGDDGGGCKMNAGDCTQGTGCTPASCTTSNNVCCPLDTLWRQSGSDACVKFYDDCVEPVA